MCDKRLNNCLDSKIDANGGLASDFKKGNVFLYPLCVINRQSLLIFCKERVVVLT